MNRQVIYGLPLMAEKSSRRAAPRWSWRFPLTGLERPAYVYSPLCGFFIHHSLFITLHFLPLQPSAYLPTLHSSFFAPCSLLTSAQPCAGRQESALRPLNLYSVPAA